VSGHRPGNAAARSQVRAERGERRMKLSLCSFEGHKIYMLITDNNIFIGLQVDNEPVVFPDVEEAKKFIKTLK
jgi:hypothetical protein